MRKEKVIAIIQVRDTAVNHRGRGEDKWLDSGHILQRDVI